MFESSSLFATRCQSRCHIRGAIWKRGCDIYTLTVYLPVSSPGWLTPLPGYSHTTSVINTTHTFNQCRLNVVPPSVMLAQHPTGIGWTYRIFVLTLTSRIHDNVGRLLLAVGYPSKPNVDLMLGQRMLRCIGLMAEAIVQPAEWTLGQLSTWLLYYYNRACTPEQADGGPPFKAIYRVDTLFARLQT